MDIEELSDIKKNVRLAPYTTFKIGGEAKYFFVAKNKEDLIETIRAAKKFKSPLFILGGGSNILVADEGFGGLVIKIKNLKSKIKGNNIFVEAGTPLSKIVNVALKNNLTGLEWAVGIPGTIGGAIYGNAGAFGKSISDAVREVEVYDIKNEKAKILKKQDCQFAYRDSIFKKNDLRADLRSKKNLIILSAKIQLQKDDKKEIKRRIKEFLEYRKENQPLNFPSAGSIFKNPQSVSAGELIKKCGLKGKKIRKAQISKKHANFILNLGGASAGDVKKLIEFTKQKVKEKFGIKLEEEICYLGFKK